MWKPEHRLAADRRGLRYPSDLTDAEWALIAPSIPPARRGGRKREVNVREVFNAIFYVLVDGLPMAGVAEGFAAQEHGALLFHAVGLGRHAGAHPRGALCRGARGGRPRSEPDRRDHRQPNRQGGSKRGSPLDPQGYDAGKKVTGRKRHILVDTLGLLLGVSVLPANIQDRDGARDLVARGAPAVSVRRAHLRRRRISGAENGRSRGRSRMLEDRDRQALRSPSLRRPAKTLDRRADASPGSAATAAWPATSSATPEPSPPSFASP